MSASRLILLCCALSVVACEKNSPAPAATPAKAAPSVTTPPEQPEAPTIKAPASIPQSLVDKLQKEWPTIQKEGDAFVAKFKEARKLHESGGARAALSKVITEANKHYIKAVEAWSAIYYSVDDYDEALADKCRVFLRSRNRAVDKWGKYNKMLKEFSTVK